VDLSLFSYLYNSCIFRFKKSMVKGLDSYEEKEDEVIKEVGRKASERPCPITLSPSKHFLSSTDGSSDP
jgi:hypothetical protein